MSFGQTIRDAREAKGLTLSKVAADTHILVQIVTDMENENFKRIPAPIYGRGFIRLIAEEVGLDPDPLIQEYMDIINGRPRPSVPPPAPVVPPVVEDPIPPRIETPPLVQPFAKPDPMQQETTSVPEHIWDPEPILPQIVPPYSSPAPEPEPAIPEPAPIPVTMPEPEPTIPEPAPIPVTIPEPEPTIPEPAPIPVTIPEPEPVPVPESAPVMPEPIPEPPAPEPQPTPVTPTPVPMPEPIPATPAQSSDVEGLPLFGLHKSESTASAEPTPSKPSSSLPPQVDPESPYLQSPYDMEGPSIGERFRKSITAASSNIVHRAKEIPRRTWRISLLAVIALLVLGLLVFGCVKLYQATSRKPAGNCANGVCEVDLTKKPAKPQPTANPTKQPTKPVVTPGKSRPGAATANGKPAVTPTKQPAKPAPKAAPGKMRSTGQKVPSLYMD